MPVACAPAPGGRTAPANAATSTAASRRMLVSLPRFRGRRETGTHPGGHRSRSQKATRPAHSVDGPRRTAESKARSEEHTSELQSHSDLVCRLLLEKKKKKENE